MRKTTELQELQRENFVSKVNWRFEIQSNEREKNIPLKMSEVWHFEIVSKQGKRKILQFEFNKYHQKRSFFILWHFLLKVHISGKRHAIKVFALTSKRLGKQRFEELQPKRRHKSLIWQTIISIIYEITHENCNFFGQSQILTQLATRMESEKIVMAGNETLWLNT